MATHITEVDLSIRRYRTRFCNEYVFRHSIVSPLHPADDYQTDDSRLDPDEPLVSPGVPIIIVDRETPLTLIASREEVRGYSMGFNGKEYESSWSGNSYMVSITFLQPGDRISLNYTSIARGARYERRELAGRTETDRAKEIKPLISRHPFAVESGHDFTEWLLPYLPR